MNYIENIYICLTAPLLLATPFLRRDGRRTLIFTLIGMTSCLLSAYVTSFIVGAAGIEAGAVAYEVAPAVEEILKALPLLLFILLFEPDKRTAINGTLLVAVGFATFENVCYLIVYGSSNLLLLVIRGFGTGAMHLVCGMIVAVGLSFIWDKIWLRTVGGIALLSFITIFHAVFNILVGQEGIVFWISTAIPMVIVIVFLILLRKRIAEP